MVVPFVLRSAPATFQRTVKAVIAEHRLLKVLNYFDVIIIYSRTFAEHLHHLEALLMALRKENIKFKLKKCQLT